jgi:hypothetical protein
MNYLICQYLPQRPPSPRELFQLESKILQLPLPFDPHYNRIS